MQTSRFQLGLIATLAVGLGFSLSSSDAIAYPAGASVSLGTNPVWSVGGSSGVALEAPESQDMIITDLFVSGQTSINTLSLDDGTVVAKFKTFADGRPIHLTSGIRIPAGQTLILSTSTSPTSYSIYVNYTLSGYYAQP